MFPVPQFQRFLCSIPLSEIMPTSLKIDFCQVFYRLKTVSILSAVVSHFLRASSSKNATMFGTVRFVAFLLCFLRIGHARMSHSDHRLRSTTASPASQRENWQTHDLSISIQSSKISVNVIIASSGRETLPYMLDSISPQLDETDFLTIISEERHESVLTMVSAVRCKCTVITVANSKPLGFWGHGSRTQWQGYLPGDYHMNGDDDDLFAPNAIENIKEIINGRLEPPTLYIFHFIKRNPDGQLVVIPPADYFNVTQDLIGTPCGVYRNIPNLPKWDSIRGGDGRFYIALKSKVAKVTFVRNIIYQVGQEEDLLSLQHKVLP